MMPRYLDYLALLAAGVLATGCSSFSGLAGSKSELACKAPDGVLCTSVSGIYANSLADALPGQMEKGQEKAIPARQAKDDAKKDGAPAAPGYFSPRDLATPNSGDPVRMAPLVLRVWIAPWEDADGDLHDQHYLYMVVHHGKWLIESNRQTIRDAFRPVFPLKGTVKPDDENPEAGAALPAAPGQGAGKP